jgi:transposase
MPAPHPPEFSSQGGRAGPAAGRVGREGRQGTGDQRVGSAPLESQDDVDAGRNEGLSTKEREELTQLRRDKRRWEMENEIVKRASAYFARENVLPK